MVFFQTQNTIQTGGAPFYGNRAAYLGRYKATMDATNEWMRRFGRRGFNTLPPALQRQWMEFMPQPFPRFDQRIPRPGPRSTSAMGPGFQGGPAMVRSTISGRRNIFSPSYVQRAVNQAAGQALGTADPRSAMKQFTSPGMSRDEGTYSAALPQITQGLAAARRAAGELPMMADIANRQYQLTGQAGAGQEALALAELLRRLQQVRDFEATSLIGPGINPLVQQLLG